MAPPLVLVTFHCVSFTSGQTVTGNCTVDVFLLESDDEADPPNWDGKENVSFFEENVCSYRIPHFAVFQ